MNYLNKKDMLVEIGKSKNTFCSFVEPRYAAYHAIVSSVDLITQELIDEIISVKAQTKGKKIGIVLSREEVVIRVPALEHIPDDLERKRKTRNINRPLIAKTNFPPFKHFILENGVLVEVGRSHWKGTIQDGNFCTTHGRMTNSLAQMFMLLVKRLGRRPNFRGYTFLDEMQAQAIVNLAENGLQFDESKSDNPFAFYTQACNHVFVRIINAEKRQRDILEDLKQIEGGPLSFARQFEAEDKVFAAKVAAKKVRAKSVAKDIKIEY